MNDRFKNWLLAELDKRDWSYRELGRQANGSASHTYTNLILSGERQITWDYCAAVAKAFGYSPVKVFLIAGLLNEDDLYKINGNGTLR